MPNKLVFIKEVKTATKNNRSWLQATDQDGVTWNIFSETPLEANKAYLFTFEKNQKGWNDIQQITPVINILQQKALKEVANRNDFIRTYSMAFSYSKDLVIGEKIPLADLYSTADEIYDKIQQKADDEITKIENAVVKLDDE